MLVGDAIAGTSAETATAMTEAPQVVYRGAQAVLTVGDEHAHVSIHHEANGTVLVNAPAGSDFPALVRQAAESLRQAARDMDARAADPMAWGASQAL